MQMGNILGSGGKFACVKELVVAMNVDMRGRILIWEFEHDWQWYKIEVHLCCC
jgi:hypothetical protein